MTSTHSDRRWRRKTFAIVIAAVSCSFAFVGLCIVEDDQLRWLTYGRHAVDTPIQFDAETWNDSRDGFRSAAPRYRMALGLVEQGALIGKTRNELVALLGEAEYVFRDGTHRYFLRTEGQHKAELIVHVTGAAPGASVEITRAPNYW